MVLPDPRICLRLECHQLSTMDLHSVVALCIQVMVAGSEATSEYRVQVFTPPYLLSGATRPTLTTVPTAMGYNKTYTIAYGGTACIDRVVVIRQSSVTHGIHMVSWSCEELDTPHKLGHLDPASRG